MTGSGTLLDPYVIWDVNDLQDMNLDLTAYYKLGQDIDASATIGWNGGEGFIPVGSWPAPAVPFSGHFDGRGHAITELYMNRPIALGAPDCNFQALFGYTWASGEIKNVQILDCDITAFEWVGALVGFHSPGCGKVSNCFSTGIIKALVGVGGLLGYNGVEVERSDSQCEIICVGGEDGAIEEVGGFIGENDGEILLCHATGNIDASSNWGNWGIGGFVGLHSFRTIDQCYATGNVRVVDGGARPWESYEIGGFGGCIYGNGVSRCFAEGNVHAMGVGSWLWAIGGFAGYSDEDYLRDCYSRGDVYAEHAIEVDCVGGFIGEWWPRWGEEMRDCYSTGSITTVGPTTIYIGGFCGKEEDFPGFIFNCFWDTQTSGMATSHGGTGKTTAQMKTESTFTGAGWDFATIWDITPSCNNDYPCLLSVTPCCGVPVAPYVINKSYALAREEL